MATNKPKNEVATKKENAVASAVPSFMKNDAGKGVESMTASDMEVPRLVLLQALSPEVAEGDEKPGVFFHSIAEESLGPKLRVVPIFADIKYILWRPRHEGGGILARADDGTNWTPPNAVFDVKPYKDQPKTVKWETKGTVQASGLDKWGSSDPSDPNSQPAATKMWNFVVVLPDFPEMGPMVLTLQRGAADVGKNLTGKIKMSGLPSFGQIFEMSVKKEDKGQGVYFAPTFVKSGLVEDEQQYMEYKSLYENFKSLGLQIKDLEGAQEGETIEGGAATPEGAIDV